MNNFNKKSSKSSFAPTVATIAVTAMLLASVLITVSDAGISRFGFHSGRISRFGSIFVNDREFDLAGATIVINGQPATESDLQLGQTVFVNGQSDDELPVGSALEVDVNSPLLGFVTSIDSDEEQLTVLSHTVSTDPDTILVRESGGNGFDDFSVGDVVEVNGFISANGGIHATSIEQQSTASESRVTGVIRNLSGAMLDINALTVNFSNADIIGFPSGALSEGDNARVRGTANAAGSQLIASTVEFIPGFTALPDDVGEFEGLISNFISPAEFSIGGISVATNQNTGFIGGGPANLTEDSNVVVRGQFDASGSLLADDITIRGTRIRVYGVVNSTSATSITVLGVPLLATATTRFDDGSDADVDPLGIADINAGDYIEARSLKDPAAITPVIAARIKREDSVEDVLLQGFMGATGTQDFEVLGVLVHVDSDTEFEDANDDEISSAKFFNAISAGTFVKVRGTSQTGTSITATNVSLQIHD